MTSGSAPAGGDIFAEYLRLFNAGQHFEAHEALEVLWRSEAGPAKPFYQGMIQIAAVFVHLKQGNQSGARQLYGKAITNLKAFGPVYAGIDIMILLEDVGRCLKARRTDYRLQAAAAGRS